MGCVCVVSDALSLSCDKKTHKTRVTLVYTEVQIRSCHGFTLETGENYNCNAAYNIHMAAVTFSTKHVPSLSVFLGQKSTSY